MNRLLFALLFFLLSGTTMESQTILSGEVRDDKEPLIGASVKVTEKGILIRGGITDVEGKYRIQVDSGIYEVEVSYTGYNTYKVEKVKISSERINFFDVVLNSGLTENTAEITCHFGRWADLLDKDPTNTGQTFTADQIRHMY